MSFVKEVNDHQTRDVHHQKADNHQTRDVHHQNVNCQKDVQSASSFISADEILDKLSPQLLIQLQFHRIAGYENREKMKYILSIPLYR